MNPVQCVSLALMTILLFFYGLVMAEMEGGVRGMFLYCIRCLFFVFLIATFYEYTKAFFHSAFG